MKRKKGLLATAVILAIAIVSLTVPSFAASASRTTALDLTIETADGDPTTDIDKTSSEGWKWTAASKTLTLNGFNMDVDSSESTYAVFVPAGTTIELQGTNQLMARGVDGISADFAIDPNTNLPNGDLTICGTGTLNAYTDGDKHEVVEFYGTNLIIKDCTLNLEALVGFEAIYDAGDYGNLSISNAKVTAIGKDGFCGIYMDKNITINNSTVNASSDSNGVYCGGTFTAANSTLNMSSEKCAAISSELGASFTNCTVDLESSDTSLCIQDDGNVDIKDCQFTAKSSDGCNFYFYNNGDMTVTNSTLNLTATRGVLNLYNGNISVSGSVINAITSENEGFYIECENNDMSLLNSTININSQYEAIQFAGNLDINNCKLNIISSEEEGIDVYDGDISIKNSIGTISASEDGIQLDSGNLLIDSSNLTVTSDMESGIYVYDGALNIINSDVTTTGVVDCGINVEFGPITFKDSSIVATGGFAGIQSQTSWNYESNAFYDGGYITIDNSDVDAKSTDGGFGIISLFCSNGDINSVMPVNPTIKLNGNTVVLQGGSISIPYGTSSLQAPQLRAKIATNRNIACFGAYTFTPDGKTFSWDYVAQKTTNVSPCVVIRAVNTINFETNGGSFVAPLTGLKAGDKINLPANPTKDGATFAGWYLDKALTKKLPDGAIYKRGITTLYASWNLTVKDTPAPKAAAPKANVPKTGDANDIIGLSTLGITSILGAGIISRKSKYEMN
ncbi:MAG: InlB B-repeat-containing protein [Oscillospiraceae bacterium]